MSQAECDASYAWLTQQNVVKAYVFLLELEQHPDTFLEFHMVEGVRHRVLDQVALSHLIKVLNALVLARWSDSGLQAIKQGAWKAYEQRSA